MRLIVILTIAPGKDSSLTSPRFNAHGRSSADCPRSLATAVFAVQSADCQRRNAREVLTRRLICIITFLWNCCTVTVPVFIERCTKGTYSTSGLKTCKACPKGFYQPSTGSTSCQACPYGLTTWTEGAVHADECSGIVTILYCPIVSSSPFSSTSSSSSSSTSFVEL